MVSICIFGDGASGVVAVLLWEGALPYFFAIVVVGTAGVGEDFCREPAAPREEACDRSSGRAEVESRGTVICGVNTAVNCIQVDYIVWVEINF
eukprot:2785255-Pyramimonas_sp.AAC.2